MLLVLSEHGGRVEGCTAHFSVLLSGAQLQQEGAVVTVQVEDDGRTVQVEASLLVLKLPPGVQIAGQPRASGPGLTGAVQSTDAPGTAQPQSEAQSQPPGAVGQAPGESSRPCWGASQQCWGAI